jgi:hypothetical protein
VTGATAGVELARRAAGAASGRAAEELARLADEIARDRDELLSIMGSLDVPVQRFKVYTGWLAEKVGRLKLNGRIAGRSPLSDLVELEGLRMAVQGKAAGWETLRARTRRGVDPARLDDLAARAERQLATLDDLHAAAANELFGTATSV